MSITIKQLLESGSHFGHSVKRLHPSMKSYVFAERNGIHIIDLQKTYGKLNQVKDIVYDAILDGKKFLFLCTKKQTQTAIEEAAKECGMFHITQRWIGGLLTNFKTIQKSILDLNELEEMEKNNDWKTTKKKEISRLQSRKNRLSRYFSGVHDMDKLPDFIFIIDPRKEKIAILEAYKKNIPVIALVDTNVDCSLVTYPIPGNDDAIRSVTLFAHFMKDVINQAREAKENIIEESLMGNEDNITEMDMTETES